MHTSTWGRGDFYFLYLVAYITSCIIQRLGVLSIDNHDPIMTAGAPDERQPLLQHEYPSNGMALPGKPIEVKESSPRHLGPLEITRATRTGILAGIWVAMFLAVSSGTK